MHYGVKGMKWGVRKEYQPVGRRSASAKAASGRKAISKRANGKHGMDPYLEADLIAYSIYTIALIAMVGGKRISDLAKQGWFKEKYTPADIKKTKTTKEYDLQVINKIPGVSDKTLSYALTGGDLTKVSIDEQRAMIKAVRDGYFTNCVYCTTAAALRKKGYDVEAKNSPGRGHSASETLTWWKGSEYCNFKGDKTSNPKEVNKLFKKTIKSGSPRNYDQECSYITKTLAKQGNGASGDFLVETGRGMGHSVEYRVEKNKVRIYDNQIHKKYDSVKEFFDAMNKPMGGATRYQPAYSQYIRFDNCEPDLDRMLKKHVIKPRGAA